MELSAIKAALPAFLEPQLAEYYGAETADRILTGLGSTRPTTLRSNTLRSSAADVAESLAAAGVPTTQVPWYADAFVLGENTQGVSLWDTPLIKEGRVYVQSLSSMLPPLFMDLKPGMDVLDMCAAPGGKTTQMAALGQGAVHITACEQSPVRADKLQFNLEKQGITNVPILRQDARKLNSFFSFDRVLLDAPCSGSGTLFAGDPKLSKRFSADLVRNSCKKQSALLAKALEIVKPGAFVLYSTCSVLKCENEEIVTTALKRAAKKGSYKVEALDLAEYPEVPLLPSTIESAVTVCPTHQFEGFFMCKIRRYA